MRTWGHHTVYILILVVPPPPPTTWHCTMEICPLFQVLSGVAFDLFLPAYFFTPSLVPILCVSHPSSSPRSGSLRNIEPHPLLSSPSHTYSGCSPLLQPLHFIEAKMPVIVKDVKCEREVCVRIYDMYYRQNHHLSLCYLHPN